VRIHSASINCQFHVFLWNFEVLGVGVKHRSGVSVSVCVMTLFDEQQEKGHTHSEAEQSVFISLSHMYMSQDS
jgi:hypothetical protein